MNQTDPTTTPSKRIPPGDLRRWLVWAYEFKRFGTLADRLSPPDLGYLLREYGAARLRREESPSVAPVVLWLAARICNFGDRHLDLTETFTRRQMIGGVWAKDGSLIQPGTGAYDTQNRLARQRAEELGLMSFTRMRTCLGVRLSGEGIVRYCAEEVIAWMQIKHGDGWRSVVRQIAREIGAESRSVRDPDSRQLPRPRLTAASVTQTHGQTVTNSSNSKKQPSRSKQQQAAAARGLVGSLSGPQVTTITQALQQIGHTAPLPASMTKTAASLTEEQATGIALRLVEVQPHSPVGFLRAALRDPDSWQSHDLDPAVLRSPLTAVLRDLWLRWLRTTPTAHDLETLRRGLLPGTDLQRCGDLREYGEIRNSGSHDYGDPSRPLTVKGILEHAPALRRRRASGHDHDQAVRKVAAEIGVAFDEKGKAQWEEKP